MGAERDDAPTEPWRDPSRYYPGDDVVDWIGIDGYNWGTTRTWSAWRGFGEIFEPVYTALAGRKPMMISETASTEQGGAKAAWIDDMALALPRQFPQVHALIWFDSGPRPWRSARPS